MWLLWRRWLPYVRVSPAELPRDSRSTTMAAPVTLAQLPQVLQATTAANNEIRRASERALNQVWTRAATAVQVQCICA